MTDSNDPTDPNSDDHYLNLDNELSETVRQSLISLIEQAHRCATESGLLYSVKYLSAARIAAEIEAGDDYYLREADEEVDQLRARGRGDYRED